VTYKERVKCQNDLMKCKTELFELKATYANLREKHDKLEAEHKKILEENREFENENEEFVYETIKLKDQIEVMQQAQMKWKIEKAEIIASKELLQNKHHFQMKDFQSEYESLYAKQEMTKRRLTIVVNIYMAFLSFLSSQDSADLGNLVLAIHDLKRRDFDLKTWIEEGGTKAVCFKTFAKRTGIFEDKLGAFKTYLVEDCVGIFEDDFCVSKGRPCSKMEECHDDDNHENKDDDADGVM
jgi:hypothetical protein